MKTISRLELCLQNKLIQSLYLTWNTISSHLIFDVLFKIPILTILVNENGKLKFTNSELK